MKKEYVGNVYEYKGQLYAMVDVFADHLASYGISEGYITNGTYEVRHLEIGLEGGVIKYHGKYGFKPLSNEVTALKKHKI